MTVPNHHIAWIAEPEELAVVCARASACERVAIDTEADSFHSYFHKLCLVQLSFDATNTLIDPLRLGRDGLAPLAGLLANPKVQKVMHGADYDVRVLDRDLGAHVAGLRDTQLAAQLLGDAATGLANLVQREFGVELDKRLQRTDWAQRPLSDAERAYAAADTAYLGDLVERMEARLSESGRMAWWLEECAELERVRWTPPEPDPLAFDRVKGARALKGVARDRLAALHAWRERLAAERDVPTFRVLRNDVMIALALDPPEDLAALAERNGVGSSFVRRSGRDVLALLAAAPEAPPRPQRAAFRPDPELENRFKALRAVRDARAAELTIEPGVLAPRAGLEAVARHAPRSEAALFECLGRRWRTEVLADVLLPVAAPWSPLGATDADTNG